MVKRLSWHIGFWTAYVLLMGFLAGRYDLRFKESYLSELAQLPAKAGAVYVALEMINRWRISGREVLLIAQIAVVVVAAALINRVVMFYILYPAFYADQYTMHFWSLDRMLYTCIDVGTVTAAAIALKLTRQRIAHRDKERRLTEERLQAELRFLRSQTNPHFLFNTLNNIYALARHESPRAAAQVMQLSKLLRFMLYECSSASIRVTDEIQVIKDLIELEKIRYGEGRLRLSFAESIDNPQEQIAPLLLLPFVENAFKHGAGESRDTAEIAIELKVIQGVLTFTVDNSTEAIHDENAQNTGLGLRNAGRQLELLYPHSHKLEIIRKPGRFTIQLTMQLRAYEAPSLPDR
jgi:sensor histidine kinase YesM